MLPRLAPCHTNYRSLLFFGDLPKNPLFKFFIFDVLCSSLQSCHHFIMFRRGRRILFIDRSSQCLDNLRGGNILKIKVRLSSQEELEKACEEDRQFQRWRARCKERYERYLELFELFRGEGTEGD